MSTPDIRSHVGELYGVDISPTLASAVTDSVIDEGRAWQSRPLESTYAIVFFDALRVKIRDEGLVRNKAVYLAIGVRCSAHQEVLGLWIEQSEGAKFWMCVMNELRARGLADIGIAVVDGLKGFPEAITAVYPDTVVQTCSCISSATPSRTGVVERPRAPGAGAQTHLSGRQPGRSGACINRVRTRPMGRAISDCRAELAPALGTHHSVLRLLSSGAQDALHH